MLCGGDGRFARAVFFQEFFRRDEERILLHDAADENHRVSSHDVNDEVAATFGQIIKTDDRILMMRNDVVQPALVLRKSSTPGQSPEAHSAWPMTRERGKPSRRLCSSTSCMQASIRSRSK